MNASSLFVRVRSSCVHNYPYRHFVLVILLTLLRSHIYMYFITIHADKSRENMMFDAE
jgi:hypothetical protein